MQVVRLLDKDKSIFTQNPGLELVHPFNELYAKGEDGDRIMKAIYLIHDIMSPIYKGVPTTEERIADVNTNYLIHDDFPWDEYGKFVRAYQDICRSDIQKKLDIMRTDIDEREAFFRSLSWGDPDDMIIKERMMSSHKGFVEDYNKLNKAVQAEAEEIESYGGYIKSFLETIAQEEKSKVEG